jgi:hypothetical protein
MTWKIGIRLDDSKSIFKDLLTHERKKEEINHVNIRRKVL